MNNIRLVEDRRRTTQMVHESIDWLYCALAGLILGGMWVAIPHIRAWASQGWGL